MSIPSYVQLRNPRIVDGILQCIREMATPFSLALSAPGNLWEPGELYRRFTALAISSPLQECIV